MTARRMLSAVERVTSYHEAGHACVSVALRIPFTKVDIIPQKDHSGWIRNRKSRAAFLKNVNPSDDPFYWVERKIDPRLVDWVERRIICIFAGGIAERRYAPRSDWASGMGHDGLDRDYYRDEDGDLVCFTSPWIAPDSDLHHIEERLEFLGRHGDTAYRAQLEERSKSLVRELWPEIKIVAAALLKYRTLTQAQVRQLMKRTAARR
jgi:hypothetical protein